MDGVAMEANGVNISVDAVMVKVRTGSLPSLQQGSRPTVVFPRGTATSPPRSKTARPACTPAAIFSATVAAPRDIYFEHITYCKSKFATEADLPHHCPRLLQLFKRIGFGPPPGGLFFAWENRTWPHFPHAIMAEPTTM
jgi:hypothetical protein